MLLHLRLELLDFLPPFKGMYICDVCNCTYHWQCLLKINCSNANEKRLMTPMTHGPAQPVLTQVKIKKEQTLKPLKRELVKVCGT